MLLQQVTTAALERHREDHRGGAACCRRPTTRSDRRWGWRRWELVAESQPAFISTPHRRADAAGIALLRRRPCRWRLGHTTGRACRTTAVRRWCRVQFRGRTRPQRVEPASTNIPTAVDGIRRRYASEPARHLPASPESLETSLPESEPAVTNHRDAGGTVAVADERLS